MSRTVNDGAQPVLEPLDAEQVLSVALLTRIAEAVESNIATIGDTEQMRVTGCHQSQIIFLIRDVPKPLPFGKTIKRRLKP